MVKTLNNIESSLRRPRPSLAGQADGSETRTEGIVQGAGRSLHPGQGRNRPGYDARCLPDGFSAMKCKTTLKNAL